MKKYNKNKLQKKQTTLYKEELNNIKEIINSSSPTKLKKLDKYILNLNLNNEERANIMLYTSVYLAENGFYDKASRYLKIIEKIEDKEVSVKRNFKETQSKVKIRRIANKNRR